MSSTSSELGHATEILSGRLRVLSIARILAVLATVLVLAPSAAAEEAGSVRDLLSVVSAIYLVGNFVVLLGLRYFAATARWQLDLSLLLDAGWVSVVLWATGGAFSPFIFLMYLQLVAATVLFTWRTGLKLATLDTIGLVWLSLATSGGDAQVFIGTVPVQVDTDIENVLSLFGRNQVVFNIVALWLISGATAYFSSVNERDLRRSNRELAVLRELNTELEASLDIGDVSEAIARGVVEELDYARSVVWMSQSGGELVPAGARGFSPDELEALNDLRLSVGTGPVAKAIESREPRLVPREAARPAALADAFSIDAPLVLVPLVTEGRLLGLLTVEVKAPPGRAPRIRGRDIRILATLATEASLALDNARLHAELRDLSVTDALTGVYNHRYFQQRLQEELDRALRRGGEEQPEPVSLILMDIDFFKKVNDRFGHPSGDELLRAFARLSSRVVRSTDVICRYGGEEFAIILPGTTLGQATQVAERLREAIARSNFTGADGRYLGRVTASFGVASFAEGLPSRGDLIQRADQALYEAKESGRNRVEVREPSPETVADLPEGPVAVTHEEEGPVGAP
ncbi:MAG: sensor domain-containing diguanylate cyclase [Nitriliruptorales bacterium]|nr:sensor domain-containing diguanylate cyclase [Nitriliruptorales bacterium]